MQSTESNDENIAHVRVLAIWVKRWKTARMDDKDL